MNPARQENMPTGKFFFLPSKHWFPSGWTTSMITTGSRKAQGTDEIISESVASQSNLTYSLKTWTCPQLNCSLNDNRGQKSPTDSWIAGVVNALEAPAVRVQAAPLVSALLQAGAAATRRTEAVAVVPRQHRSSLSHDSWRTATQNQTRKDLNCQTKGINSIHYQLLLR